MQAHEVIRNLFKQISPKELASSLGVSVSLIYKWAEPSGDFGSGAPNPLERTAALLAITGDLNITKWLCSQSGGFFTKNPNSTSLPDSSSAAMASNRIVQDFANVLSSIAIAAMDNKITTQEATQIRNHWENLKSVTENFVHCCEQGNFAEVRSTLNASITEA